MSLLAASYSESPSACTELRVIHARCVLLYLFLFFVLKNLCAAEHTLRPFASSCANERRKVLTGALVS